MARWTLFSALLLAGCASPPPRPAASEADLSAWVAAEETAPARSRVLLRGPVPAPFSMEPVTLRTHAAEVPRPRRRGHIDVSFQRAEMVSAFQLLADAGRFNLVMQDGLSGHVSATLKGIDPYDALVALAEANGVAVRYEGDVVVVKKK
jgi:hypothetical protein